MFPSQERKCNRGDSAAPVPISEDSVDRKRRRRRGGEEAAMVYEGEEGKNRKRKKKAKKDKWGQPVLAAAEDGEEPVESPQQEDGRLSSGEWYEPYKVVVSGLPYSTTEQQIRDLFKDVGPIQQLQLSRFPDSGNFRGLAFLTFQVQLPFSSTSSLSLSLYVFLVPDKLHPPMDSLVEFLGQTMNY